MAPPFVRRLFSPVASCMRAIPGMRGRHGLATAAAPPGRGREAAAPTAPPPPAGRPSSGGAGVGGSAAAAPAVPGLVRDVWHQESLSIKYPALQKDCTTDVCIVGAGISGLTTAYCLAKAGKRVVVLEGRTRGSGMTGRTTAHIMQWNDDFFYKVESLHGTQNAKLVADAHVRSIDWIESVVAAERIDCDFVRLPGYLFPAGPESQHTEALDKELAAVKRLGMSDVERVTLSGDPSVGGITDCLRFPRCGDFHPLRYLDGLAAAVVRLGGVIHEGTLMTSYDASGKVTTSTGCNVYASDGIVLATCSPPNMNLAIHARQEADRTYAIGLALKAGSSRSLGGGTAAAAAALPRAQFWDTLEAYHYVRVTPDGDADVLIVGGEDQKAGVHPDAFHDSWGRLEKWARERWGPLLGDVVYRWTGLVFEPADSLGLYGLMPLDPANLAAAGGGGGQQQQQQGSAAAAAAGSSSTTRHYVITGDSGQGMTGGTIGGIIVADLITGKPNPWADVYTPARVLPTIKDWSTLASEAAATAKGFAERLLPRSLKDLRGIVDAKGVERSVAPGEGMVVEEGLRKVALYRDGQGVVHRRSAICTHMGCLVEWNPLDKTFDCPCHGSIFDRNGRCINGPAIKDLEDLGSIKLQPAAGEPAGEAIDAAAIDSAAAGGGSTIPTAGSSNQQSQQQPPGTSRQ